MSYSPDEVSALHHNDDVDGSPFSHHHTLGPNANQAASGNHDHDDTYVLKTELAELLPEIRRGGVSITGTGSSIAEKVVTFDPPFGSLPIVVATCRNGDYFAYITSVSTASVTIGVRQYQGRTFTGTLVVNWIAIGV